MGILLWKAVSSSIAYWPKAPSPIKQTTCLSILASFAPIAIGTPGPTALIPVCNTSMVCLGYLSWVQAHFLNHKVQFAPSTTNVAFSSTASIISLLSLARCIGLWFQYLSSISFNFLLYSSFRAWRVFSHLLWSVTWPWDCIFFVSLIICWRTALALPTIPSFMLKSAPTVSWSGNTCIMFVSGPMSGGSLINWRVIYTLGRSPISKATSASVVLTPQTDSGCL